MYKFFFIIHACTGKRKRKRSLDCARDDDTERAAPFLFIPLREPTSAPSGHLLPGEGGSVPPPASSFRAKARNLFRSRSAKRGEDDGSRETPCTLRRGMPIRERTVSHSFSSRLGSEPPLFRGTSFRGKEGVCRLPPSPLFPHLNTRTGWRPVRAVFLESSEWSSHKTIGL